MCIKKQTTKQEIDNLSYEKLLEEADSRDRDLEEGWVPDR